MDILENELLPIQLMEGINAYRGAMWEKIAEFGEQMKSLDGYLKHKAGTPMSKEMEEVFTLNQTLEGGLYTRELFMPAGELVISMIHKQQHPSFLLKGKVSYLMDTGEVKTIEGPHIIHTQTGTQRVIYVHEDTRWCCVYRTDAKTFEEAEADVYAESYKELPQEIINKTKLIWQE
jgi:hypothetical protein